MNDLLAEIQRLIDELQQMFQELIDAINSALSWVPWGLGWVVDRIHEAFDQLRRQWDEFWAMMSEFYGNFGDLGALEDVQARWSDEVGGPVSSEVGTIERGSLLADDRWVGTAASAYFQRAALHKTALEKVQQYASTASSAIDSVRAGLVTFYVLIITALITLVIGLAKAVVATGTIIGIPVAVLAVVAVVAIAFGQVYGGGLVLKSQCNSAQNDLNRQMGDQAGFPDGAWPSGAVLT